MHELMFQVGVDLHRSTQAISAYWPYMYVCMFHARLTSFLNISLLERKGGKR